MFQNTDVFAQERELLKVAGNFFDIVNHSVFTSNFFKAMGTHFVITFDSLRLATFRARAANKIPPKYKKAFAFNKHKLEMDFRYKYNRKTFTFTIIK